MKIFRDNIWGDIQVSTEALQWIDTVEFQRLHSIRQTGVAYKVFPTANVTRFAHSIGAYHVTRMLLDILDHVQPESTNGLSIEQREWICLAALLHDIGHGPFSHAFDEYCIDSCDEEMQVEWTFHENRSVDIVAYMNCKYDLGVNVSFIQSLIDPIGHPDDSTSDQWFQHLISNPITGIDTDKMDYLVRDNQQFGLSMNIDIQRILHNCRVIDNTLCFCDKVQGELWNLFLIRHRLHATIYRHPRILHFEKELLDIFSGLEHTEHFQQVLREKNVPAFMKWTDYYILIMADPNLKRNYDIRTSPLPRSKEFRHYHDHQFPKLVHTWFYHRNDPTVKFHMKFPSPYCPFSIPI